MNCHDYPLKIGVDSKLVLQLHKVIKIHDLKQVHGDIARIPLKQLGAHVTPMWEEMQKLEIQVEMLTLDVNSFNAHD
jgi:hypothetical protein